MIHGYLPINCKHTSTRTPTTCSNFLHSFRLRFQVNNIECIDENEKSRKKYASTKRIDEKCGKNASTKKIDEKVVKMHRRKCSSVCTLSRTTITTKITDKDLNDFLRFVVLAFFSQYARLYYEYGFTIFLVIELNHKMDITLISQ